MKSYILIKVRTGEIHEVVKQLRRLPSVRSAEMTFGPYDVIVIAENDDLSSLGTLIANQIQPIPGVEQTLTCLAINI